MPQTDDKAKADDQEVEITKSAGAPAPERQTYKVISEAGLFKNGQQIEQGETVELDAQTAANFIAAGDVEEA